jgi:hypothetical protein
VQNSFKCELNASRVGYFTRLCPRLRVKHGVTNRVATLSITLLLTLTSCTQSVHVKTSQRVSQLIIDGKELGPIGPEGKDVAVPVKFGSAKYTALNGDTTIASGLLARTQINPWTYGLSVGGAMVLAPTIGFGCAVAVNPSWFFAPSVFLEGGGIGAFWAYLSQTASIWTIPAATIGIAIGLLPLLGFLYSERLPDVVWINTDYMTK